MCFLKKLLAKKRAIKINSQLDSIKTNPELLFQIDIVRGSSVELQVFRQNSVDQFGLTSENKEGYIIILVFNPKDSEYNFYVNNFKKSKYFDLMKVGVLDKLKFPILFINGDFSLMESTLNEIQFEIFNYTTDEKYDINVTLI